MVLALFIVVMHLSLFGKTALHVNDTSEKGHVYQCQMLNVKVYTLAHWRNDNENKESCELSW